MDTYTLAGRDGDVFLICSDGLTGDDLGRRGRRRSCAPPASLDEAAEALVRAANQSGGKDNITVDPVPPRARARRATSRRRPSDAGRSGATRTRSPADISAADVRRRGRRRLAALGDAPPDATVVRPPRPARTAAPARRRSRPRRRRRGAAPCCESRVALLLVRGGGRPASTRSAGRSTSSGPTTPAS